MLTSGKGNHLKVFLCYPPTSPAYSRIRDAGLAPHMALLCIAGHLLSRFDDVEVQMIDGHHDGMETIRRAIEQFGPDLVGCSVDFTNYDNAVEVCAFAKSLDERTFTVLGSNHASNLYRQILDNQPCIDFISLGDGEPSWEDLVRIRCGELGAPEGRNLAYRDDNSEVAVTTSAHLDLDEMAPVRYDLVDLERYFAVQRSVMDEEFRMLQFTSQRGCANRPLCVFCGRYTDGLRFRDPAEFASEVAYWAEKLDLTEVWDRSDSFIQNKQWLMRFCDELEKRTDRFRTGRSTFKTYARADQLLSPDVCECLKRLNFRMVFIGYEAGDDRILKNIGKHATCDVYRRATRNVFECGLDIDASFIVGLPGENRESLANHLSFVRELVAMGLTKIRVNRLLVLPGTPLYEAVMRLRPELRDRDSVPQEELQCSLFKTDLYDLADFNGDEALFEDALRQTADAMTAAVLDEGGGAEGYGYGKNANILSGRQFKGKQQI